MAHLALGGFGSVFDLSKQPWLDPDATVRDLLRSTAPRLKAKSHYFW
jgi:uncharacterized Fe-S cluster protein YjdI